MWYNLNKTADFGLEIDFVLNGLVGEYRDSLLETARQAPTIVAQGCPSWVQSWWMWQQRQSLSACIWFQDYANLRPLSPCPRRQHPHLSLCSFFFIFLHLFIPLFSLWNRLKERQEIRARLFLSFCGHTSFENPAQSLWSIWDPMDIQIVSSRGNNLQYCQYNRCCFVLGPNGYPDCYCFPAWEIKSTWIWAK